MTPHQQDPDAQPAADTATDSRAEANEGDGRTATPENLAPPATGRAEDDPLDGASHSLAPAEAKRVRAQERLVQGKAVAQPREPMYEDLEGVGEAGSMAHPTGQEDRNPIGPRE